MKYQIETMLGRKPKTDLEIIDECDEFLDSFANERRINLNRLHAAISNLMPSDQEKRRISKELLHKINDLLLDPPKIGIEKIMESPFINLIEIILENPNLAEDEEINYYNDVIEMVKSFESVINETYTSMDIIKKDGEQKGLFGKNFSNEDTVIINLVSINLAQKLNELIEANNVLVLMSGTLHSPEVLKNIFGLEDFKIVEAETKNPGIINKERTGIERNCSFANFSNGTITRDMYLKMMDLCLANAEEPVLVHVNAFKDLPSEEENNRLKFDNLITQERLREIQRRGNMAVEDFSNKSSKILFTTKCSRGVDFAGDKCNSIVITRFPYPNIQELFWKILKKEQPEKFMEFYLDKARRTLIQKIARGVRFKGDKVSLWSPDLRVINASVDG
jgi:Rad3-related DNA helicase